MIPQYIQPFLWSYDIKKLDLSRNKKRIITNILNLGTSKTTDWLFDVYERKDIEKVVSNPLPGEWSNKSLNFWTTVLDIKANYSERKIT